MLTVQGRDPTRGGVVDERVELTVTLLHRLHDRGEPLFGVEVGGRRGAPVGADGGDGLGQLVLVARDDLDERPGPGQTLGEDPADPPGATSDQHGRCV